MKNSFILHKRLRKKEQTIAQKEQTIVQKEQTM
jgi:hypothetical protein